MPQMVDTAEIEAQLAEMIARTQGEAEKPGYEGVVARCQIAILPAVTRWRAAEFNRGIDANTILNAIVGMCASTILGEVGSITRNPDEQIVCINKLLQGIGEEIGHMMADPHHGVEHSTTPIEAGRA